MENYDYALYYEGMTTEQDGAPERLSPEASLVHEMDQLDQIIEAYVEQRIGKERYAAARMFIESGRDLRSKENEAQRKAREHFQAKAFLEQLAESDADSVSVPLDELELRFRAWQDSAPKKSDLYAYEEEKIRYITTVAEVFAQKLEGYAIENIDDGICTLGWSFTEYTDVRVSFQKDATGIATNVFLVHHYQDESLLFGRGTRYEPLDESEYADYEVDPAQLIHEVVRAYGDVNTLLEL